MDFDELIANSIEETKQKGRPTNASKNLISARERVRQAQAVKNAEDFPKEIIERVKGEVLEDAEDNEQKLLLYRETAFSVLEKYIVDNPERVRKQVSNWNMDLFIHIRKAIPKVDTRNTALLDGLYSIYVEVCARVGAVPSYYGFSFFSGIPCATLEQWKNGANLSSTHQQIVQKWDKGTTGTLFDRLYNGTNNTVGTIFALKQRGFVEGQYIPPDAIKEARKLNDLPIFEIEDHSENS